MSLVELMIALGMLSILALGFASFVVNQQKSMSALEQKADSIELRNYLMLSLQNASICTCQLNPNLTEDDSNDTNLWFNSNITDGSQTIDLKKLRTGCGVSDPIIALEGKVLSSGLTMEKIELKNIVPTGVTNEWQGDIVISWLQSSLKYSLKPISQRQKFLIDPTSPAANRIIRTCVANNGNPYGSIGIGEYVIVPQNTVQQAATDGFLTMYIGQNNAADNSAYICAGTNKADVSSCYVLPGGIGPGADTILTRATGYSGSSAMIKKGQWFQVQSIDPNGDGGIATGFWLPLGQ
jgi:Tfp pilus assembly protein PilV